MLAFLATHKGGRRDQSSQRRNLVVVVWLKHLRIPLGRLQQDRNRSVLGTTSPTESQ